VDNLQEEVHVCIVGKYTGLQDSYLSVIRALQHASFEVNRKLVIDWIEATDLEVNTQTSAPEKYQAVCICVISAYACIYVSYCIVLYCMDAFIVLICLSNY